MWGKNWKYNMLDRTKLEYEENYSEQKGNNTRMWQTCNDDKHMQEWWKHCNQEKLGHHPRSYKHVHQKSGNYWPVAGQMDMQPASLEQRRFRQ